MLTKANPTAPPTHLGRGGRRLWDAVQSEYGISDGAGLELLRAAAEARDRLDEAGAAVRKDGAVIVGDDGKPRANPACAIERDARSGMLQALSVAPRHRAGRPTTWFIREAEIVMPTNRRVSQRRLGTKRPPIWEDRISHAQWLEHREALMLRAGAGKRPAAWWRFEAPEPRDEDVTECLQLYNLNVLTRAEIDALRPQWREDEKRARTIDFFCEGPDQFLEGRASYLAWRAWAGIPDDVIPPQLSRVFKIKKAKVR